MKLDFLKSKYKNGYIRYYFCGVYVYKKKTPICEILKAFKQNEALNTLYLDEKIAKYIEKEEIKNKLSDVSINNGNKIAFLSTEFYDTGGHTDCALNIIKLLAEQYEIGMFFAKLQNSYNKAPEKMESISKYAKIDGIDFDIKTFDSDLISLYNKIIQFAPRVIFVYMHTDCVLCAACLALLKKHTAIKIIYFNHGSHCSALGFGFADLILEGLPAAHYVTKHFRKIDKCKVIGLSAKSKSETIYYTKDEITELRNNLGVIDGEYMTLSGGSSYKFFDGKKSEYFEMIKNLLIREPKLKHVVMSDFSSSKRKLINKILGNGLKDRIKIIPLAKDFDIYFQSCDVFIDSFPFSGALVQIDIMRNQRPTIIKINAQNALFAFHEYMPKNYPYMYKTPQEIEEGVLNLLYDKNEQNRIIEMNYAHYLDNYEGDSVKRKYINIIENCENLEQFYEKLDENLNYNFEEIK